MMGWWLDLEGFPSQSPLLFAKHRQQGEGEREPNREEKQAGFLLRFYVPNELTISISVRITSQYTVHIIIQLIAI